MISEAPSSVSRRVTQTRGGVFLVGFFGLFFFLAVSTPHSQADRWAWRSGRCPSAACQANSSECRGNKRVPLPQGWDMGLLFVQDVICWNGENKVLWLSLSNVHSTGRGEAGEVWTYKERGRRKSFIQTWEGLELPLQCCQVSPLKGVM